MNRRRITAASAIVLAASAAGGCINRTIVVDSEPQGALVYLNDEEVGRTPTRVPFTFYGVYDVRLKKEGYQTLHTAREAKPPWYDTIGADLVSGALPWTDDVTIEWSFELAEPKDVSERAVLDHARQMRALLKREAAEGAEAEDEPDAAAQQEAAGGP